LSQCIQFTIPHNHPLLSVSKFIVRLRVSMKKCQFQLESGRLVLNRLSKNSTKESQHQTPSNPSFGASRSFVLCFSPNSSSYSLIAHTCWAVKKMSLTRFILVVWRGQKHSVMPRFFWLFRSQGPPFMLKHIQAPSMTDYPCAWRCGNVETAGKISTKLQ